MLATIFLFFVNFAEHAIVPGESSGVVISNSEEHLGGLELKNLSQAYLPPQLLELTNKKHKKVIRKRSAGRVVDLPSDVIKRLENVPLSELSPTIEENRKIILETHNKLRKQANPPASNMLKMVWSEEAAKVAQEWANKCVQGHSPAAHRRLSKYRCSENLFLSPYKVSWDVCVNTWYSEHQDFSYGFGSINGAETGHYTLLMWAATKEVGCGIAECPNLINKYNFVCVYCPAGNKSPTHTPYKKGPPCSGCPKFCDDGLCTNPCPYADGFSDCKYQATNTCGTDRSLANDCPALCKCSNGEIKD